MASMSFIFPVALFLWTFPVGSGNEIIIGDQKAVFYVYEIVYLLYGWVGTVCIESQKTVTIWLHWKKPQSSRSPQDSNSFLDFNPLISDSAPALP